MARINAEAEYQALTLSICEGMWLKRPLGELGVQPSSPMKVFCDNLAAISITKNSVHHDPTKHIELDCHFIKERV